MGVGSVELLVVVIYIVIFVVPIGLIAKKAGFHWAWSILSILPVINVIMLWTFALVKWPAVNEE